jgi:hypothetical protein
MRMDPLRLELKIIMFFVVAMHWVLVIAVPALIFGYAPLPSDWVQVFLFLAIVGYCSYTGYRAWKRGWRSRFILRAVVPTVLFLLSSAWFAFSAWKSQPDVPI